MGRQDYETETLVTAPVRAANHHADQVGYESHLVAHTLCENYRNNSNPISKAAMLVTHALPTDGFDAGEDGTGRGTPLVPIAIQGAATRENPDSGPDGVGVREDGQAFTLKARSEVQAVAFDTTQITHAANYSNPKPRDPCHPLAAGAHPPAVAFQSSQSGFREVDAHATLDSNNGSRRHNGIMQGMAVRRLTPEECEALMGLPRGYTKITPKTADGPRYKALGNSFAVPVVRWIGERIQQVDNL